MSLTQPENLAKGLFFAMVGAVMFSSKAIFIKLGYAAEADYIELLFLRICVAGPVFLIIALKTASQNKVSPISKSQGASIIGLGFLGYYLSSVFDFIGLAYISASLERLILYIYPTLVLIFGYFIFGRRVSVLQMLSLCLTYIGLIIVFGFQKNDLASANILVGGLLVLGATVSYACYVLFSGELIPKVGPVRFTALVMLVSSSFICCHYVFSKGFVFPAFDLQLYAVSAALGVICTIFPTLLLAQAIFLIGSSNTALAGGVGPISTIFLAVIFLGESLSSIQFVGAALVLLGVSSLTFLKR
ncbi:MAG: drug/metabolite transporter (DMT)-like permease [Candidatus Marinamargulisbacteria bacterium]|jgi:drug/metabolite transporter (DMT)-like permease